MTDVAYVYIIKAFHASIFLVANHQPLASVGVTTRPPGKHGNGDEVFLTSPDRLLVSWCSKRSLFDFFRKKRGKFAGGGPLLHKDALLDFIRRATVDENLACKEATICRRIRGRFGFYASTARNDSDALPQIWNCITFASAFLCAANPALCTSRSAYTKYLGMTVTGRHEAPGPRTLYDNVRAIFPNLYSAVPRIMNMYGGLARLTLLGKPVYIATSLEYVAQILHLPDKRFPKSLFGVKVPQIAKEGVFSVDGEQWIKQRARVEPVFTSDRAMAYIHAFLGDIVDFSNSLSVGEDGKIDLLAPLELLASDLTASVCYGDRGHDVSKRTVCPFHRKLLRCIDDAIEVQSSINGFVPGFISKIEERTKEVNKELLEKCNTARDSEKRPNIMGAMDTDGFSDIEKIDNLVAMITAATRNMNAPLLWALFYQSHHPYGDRVRAEIDHVFGGNSLKSIHSPKELSERLGKLKDTTKLIWETLRLHTFGVSAQRGTTVDEKIGDYTIVGGSLIYISLKDVLQSSEFQDPRNFNPDRFDDPSKTGAFIPFGGGGRQCPGREVALVYMKAVFVQLITDYKFESLSSDAHSIPLQPNSSEPKRGEMLFRMSRRKRGAPSTLPSHATGRIGPETENKRDDPSTSDGKMFDRIVLAHVSQNGSTDNFAYEISGALNSHGINVHVLPFAQWKRSERPNTLHVFMTPTYNGLSPTGAMSISDSISGNVASMDHTVIGVGNSNWAATYIRYARDLDKRLREGGSVARFDVIDIDVSRPTSDAINGIVDKLARHVNATIEPTELLVEKVNSKPLSARTIREKIYPHNVRVESNIQAVNADGTTVHSLEIHTDGQPYLPGDVISILPHNTSKDIDRALKLFDLQHDAVLSIKIKGGIRANFTVARTIHVKESGIVVKAADMFGAYLDLRAPMHVTMVKMSRSSVNGPSIARGESILSWLERAGSPVIDEAIMLWPRMLARSYSVASSATTTCRIMVGVKHNGLCSNYIAGLRQGASLTAKMITDSKMHLNDDMRFVILIAAGTGITPFMGYIEGELNRRSGSNGPSLSGLPTTAKPERFWIIYGARSSRSIVGRELLDRGVREGVCRITYAFSRQHGKERQYVQDALRESAHELKQEIHNGAYVRICGATAMGKACETQLMMACGLRFYDTWKTRKLLVEYWG